MVRRARWSWSVARLLLALCGFLLPGLAASCAHPGDGASSAAITSQAPPRTVTPAPSASRTLSATHAAAATPTQDLSLPVAQRFTPVPWLGNSIGGLQGLSVEAYYQPTGLAVSPDGTLYVATAGRSTLFHIDTFGKVLGSWGTNVQGTENAPPGTLNQPWGVALSPDGRLYIADTWNHRVQVLRTPDGALLGSWGSPGQGTDPYTLFGPRGVAVDARGRVLVTDTGNNRVLLYERDCAFVSQIGGQGSGPGQFREPVGIAAGADGRVYVADAWNARVHVLSVDVQGTLTAVDEWPVPAWGSDDWLHKPFLCLSGERLYLTDPEHDAVLGYTLDGTQVETYDLRTTGAFGLGIVTGIAVDPDGGLWVSDIGMHTWLHILPTG